MNALMSSRPRRGACREYCRSMSGAASSSTTLSLQVSPQNSVNQRPTRALLSSSLDSRSTVETPQLAFCETERYKTSIPTVLQMDLAKSRADNFRLIPANSAARNVLWIHAQWQIRAHARISSDSPKSAEHD